MFTKIAYFATTHNGKKMGEAKEYPTFTQFNQGDGCVFTQRGVPEGSDGKHTEDNFISELNLAEEISL